MTRLGAASLKALLTAASFTVLTTLASAQSGQVVTIQSNDSSASVSGELLGVVDNNYHLRTAIGELFIPTDGASCVGEPCPNAVPNIVPGEDVRLTSRDGSIDITGKMQSIEDGNYVIATDSLGDMRVLISSVECLGPGCPTGSEPQQVEALTPERRTPDLVMVGSDNVGQDLMPLVMESFADLIRATTVTEAIEFPDDIAQYIFTRADGSEYVLEVESTSSGPGLERLIAGTTDIAMSSRRAEPDEVAALAALGRGNLLDVSQEYVIGVDSIVMIVNARNPVEALSRRQLAAIYTGRITNWAEVGGPNLPIVVIARPGGSARRIFEGWALEGGESLTENAVIIDGGKKLTREVMATPGGIGYSISDNVLEAKPVDLILDCGVQTEATPFKSKAEEYLMGRRIRLYIDNQNPKAEVRQMANMMIAPAVDELVAESGYFSLGISEDSRALDRLTTAALIGQPPSIGNAARGDIAFQLAGAKRLSQTFRFSTGDFTLDSKALRDLDRLVEYLSRPENANREFIFVGFTDSVGPYPYNVQLARDRATEVLDRLRRHPNAGGLRGMKLSTVGFGEAAPVGCNEDGYGRSRNRRVEVWVR